MLSLSTQAQPAISTDVRLVDVHSLHKSGTMFLFKFFQHLASKQQAAFLSENLSPASDYSNLAETPASTRVICRCPIRHFDVEPLRLNHGNQHRIFHLRDPRDMLVSEYYSFGWIHPTDETPLDERRRQIQQMSVDEYVASQAEVCTWPVDQKYAPLEDYEFDPKFETVVKYEQMVTDFRGWCQQVLGRFGVRFPQIVAAKMAWRYRNEFKVSEESMQHKRRIAPGDHIDKLKPATIDLLNQRFEVVLKRFGYLT